MKFCQDHWNRLRAAIDARGLSQFIAKDGAEAARRTTLELEQQKVVRESWDPLMAAHWAIVNNAMSGTPAGLALMMPNEDDSDRCPLCFINGERHRAAQTDPAGKERWARADDTAYYDEWIDRAADDQLAHAKEFGLLGES